MRFEEARMANWYDELDQKHFDVPLSVIDEQIAKLCKEWGIVSKPEYMDGMRELFNRDGTLDEEYAKRELENGKKWAFGNSAKEKSWASHLGD